SRSLTSMRSNWCRRRRRLAMLVLSREPRRALFRRREGRSFLSDGSVCKRTNTTGEVGSRIDPCLGYTSTVPKLSVTVITKNEANDIGDALKSVAWADELIVVDSMSTDDTVAIARQFTDRVIVREWPGYIAQKNHAASIASHDWILSLDADERVT